MWFAHSRRARAVRDASFGRACDVRGCPRMQMAELIETRDRRGFRAHAVRQYALNDTVQCACQRWRVRGLLI